MEGKDITNESLDVEYIPVSSELRDDDFENKLNNLEGNDESRCSKEDNVAEHHDIDEVPDDADINSVDEPNFVKFFDSGAIKEMSVSERIRSVNEALNWIISELKDMKKVDADILTKNEQLRDRIKEIKTERLNNLRYKLLRHSSNVANNSHLRYKYQSQNKSLLAKRALARKGKDSSANTFRELRLHNSPRSRINHSSTKLGTSTLPTMSTSSSLASTISATKSLNSEGDTDRDTISTVDNCSLNGSVNSLMSNQSDFLDYYSSEDEETSDFSISLNIPFTKRELNNNDEARISELHAEIKRLSVAVRDDETEECLNAARRISYSSTLDNL